ncbi:hypothetical protein Glove_441g3 [Diversispora epigaea]|uniref:Uncharacterized protein n=1 Tax=Diversispora epigaea TaxID=1348612 RepID=A0A397GRT5_9GLOM|nr:hypothetical protein Glove_441g3 [Diversispora epigaea]
MASENENNSDKENIDNKLHIKEDSTYPIDNKISYKECINNVTRRSFNYVIIKEGVYPDQPKFSAPKKTGKSYKILYDYVVETSWGRATKKRIVRCEIDYNNNTHTFQFKIKYGPNFEQIALNSGSKTTISGPLLFGLQLSSVQKERESKRRGNLIKPALNCISSTLDKRAKKIATNVQLNFKNDINKIYHPFDIIKLKSIEFSVNKTDYQINYGTKNRLEEDNHIQSMIKAVDRGKISRDSYRNLTVADNHLTREYAISNRRIEITNHMNQIIKLSLVDMKEKDNLENIEVEELDITDSEIVQEILDTIGLGVRRNIKDILYYIIPSLQKERILDSSNPVIHLRISGDGRNVGRKIKHVMITVMILNHENYHHNPDYHYTIALYPGSEKYDTVKFILDPFIEELRSLKEDGLEIAGILWKFILYFSSDWKFLAICLGLNSANSKYFCPWCLCSKNQIGDLSKDWHIEKNIDEISINYNTINGHIFPPIFNMIPIDNIIFDELHVFLRITDRLWELILSEIKEHGLFNNMTRKVILDEMKRLKVSFQFWKNKDSHNWEYTSLVGEDKKKVLEHFNLELLFRPSRATLIRKLWDEFNLLYCALKNKKTNPLEFKNQAKDWLTLFLTPSSGNPNDFKNFTKGLYLPNQITPYMHALVFHGWEFIKKHKQWGVKAFSCSAVEKKNHQQVSTFFRKTFKNRGNLSRKKPAIQEIMEYENRILYFNYNSLPEPNKIKKIRIK